MIILWVFSVVYVTALSVHGKIKVTNNPNPGPCTKQNQGDFLLVKDRKGNIQLLTCDKEDAAQFGWRKITNDKGPTGEIFNPGYDCMSILDHNSEAKDGFYWITLNTKKPNKVWCDMKTDGGGYILIGKINNSIIWSVPSNDDPVKPFGKPHWCSSFGEVNIIDFRVQMASKENFATTKAHWAYRLHNPRKLKNLMIIDKGCSPNSPGIGDVEHVKNLATGDILTTTFRCSKFGIGHHPSSNTGWTMMNSCFGKPCPGGFAFHKEYPIQLDYSGSFSYSVSNNISGIEHAATAFVGCSKGDCCDCHGPLGGKQNYCFPKCQALNGGAIELNVYTWFWVRTSISKKLWTKCVDYKVEEKGIYVWYKLFGNSEVPIEGRCDRKNKALMYSGMLVVPDKTTAKNALSIPGMIVYRQDKKKLYITKDKKLNALAEEKETVGKIETLNKRLTTLEEEGKALNKTLTNVMETRLNERLTTLEEEGKALNKNFTNFMDKVWKAFNNTITQSKTKFAELESRMAKVGDHGYPGKSCLDILSQRTEATSLSNGEYWIVLGSTALKVYCDMKADGGGWTLITNLVLKQSRGMDWSLANDYRQIHEYNNKKLGLSTHALRALGTKMSFKQLRFFCRKKIPGRSFDIATKKNNLGHHVVQYFTAQTNTLPKSCGSYYRLSDDNSILAIQCSQWGYQSKYFVGKWHHAGSASNNRLFYHLAFVGYKVHWLVANVANGRWECDDYRSSNGYAISAGDFWKIYVR